MPFCPRCGKENPAEAAYCNSCGNQLPSIAASSQPPSANTQIPRTSPAPTTPNPSKVARNIVIAIVGIGIVAILLFVMFTSGLGGIQQGLQQALPPNVQVTSKNSRDGYSGLDYTLWIDASVHNSGGAGTVTVWAKVTQGGNEWTKSQSIHLDADESRDLTFEFREISFWSLNSGYYSVWVT